MKTNVANMTKKQIYMRSYNPEHYRQIHLELLNHYSHGSMRCNCCGESNVLFLTLDHINNDGAEQRRAAGSRGSFNHWVALRRRGYPPWVSGPLL